MQFFKENKRMFCAQDLKVVPHMIYDDNILCILHTIAFFATKVASERDQLPKDIQWVVVNFSFHGEW